jgi:hypothetical protein
MLNVIILRVMMLCVIMLSDIMMNVIILNVVAPAESRYGDCHHAESRYVK